MCNTHTHNAASQSDTVDAVMCQPPVCVHQTHGVTSLQPTHIDTHAAHDHHHRETPPSPPLTDRMRTRFPRLDAHGCRWPKTLIINKMGVNCFIVDSRRAPSSCTTTYRCWEQPHLKFRFWRHFKKGERCYVVLDWPRELVSGVLVVDGVVGTGCYQD